MLAASIVVNESRNEPFAVLYCYAKRIIVSASRWVFATTTAPETR
jgi:hypothetical protein